MSKPLAVYRTTNWSSYTDALRRRGSLTVWLDPEMDWFAAPSGKRGRVVAVDFAPRVAPKDFLRGIHRHGHVKLDDIVAMLEAAKLTVTESGELGYRNLQFALATAQGSH